MGCRAYELKIDLSHLSNTTQHILDRMFLEAKWYYNSLIAADDIFSADWNADSVSVKTKDGAIEKRNLKYLSSQMKQELLARAKDAIKGLSVLKKNGHKVGALGFKSRINSIPLIQYEYTFDIIGNRVRVQNVPQLMRISGLGQIPTTMETEVGNNALLIRHGKDFFIHLVIYDKKVVPSFPEKAVGVDAGVTPAMTFSNGVVLDEAVMITKKIRRLHRQLSRKERKEGKKIIHGKNWHKTNQKLNLEYQHQTNIRADIRRKIVSKVVHTYETVALQDDNIKGWAVMWGRKVNASAIGGIMRDLRNKAHTPVVVDRLTPTTQTCSFCGVRNPEMKDLSKRTFECQKCGFRTDRDWNASRNDFMAIPAEHRESTPPDNITTKTSTGWVEYFNSIPLVRASLVATSSSDAQLLLEEKEEEADRLSLGGHPANTGSVVHTVNPRTDYYRYEIHGEPVSLDTGPPPRLVMLDRRAIAALT